MPRKRICSGPAKERIAELARARRKRCRREVLEFYGGIPPSCACCGESEYQFLAIDHINGRGKQERRALKKMASDALIAWIIRSGFPSGYQVLCHNCNLSLGFYGFCPHRPDRVRTAISGHRNPQ